MEISNENQYITKWDFDPSYEEVHKKWTYSTDNSNGTRKRIVARELGNWMAKIQLYNGSLRYKM